MRFKTVREDAFKCFDLVTAPDVQRLRVAVRAGMIDAALIDGDSRCVLAHLAAPGPYIHFKDFYLFRPSGEELAIETFIEGIRPGATPKNNRRLRVLLGWIDAWLARCERSPRTFSLDPSATRAT